MEQKHKFHHSELRLKCPKCGSIKMRVYEGKNIIPEIRYSDGSGEKEQIEYPLEVYCAKCGYLVRQEGGPVL